MTQEEKELYNAANAYAFDIDSGDLNTNRDTFVAGAEWQKEQFEKERLKHCDELTAEQAQIESEFVTQHLKKNNRIPTYIDAIEYGEQILANSAKTCKDEQKPADKVEPRLKVRYAGSEYNVLEVKDIAGVTFYGIEDEPNHIDYVQAENCERVDGYSIKENGSPYPTKPAMFSEQNPAWSEEDKNMIDNIIDYMNPMPIFFESTKEKSGKEYTQEFVKNAINWLKSLKEN